MNGIEMKARIAELEAKLAAAQQGVQPTDEELKQWGIQEQFMLFVDEEEFLDIARSVLQKFATHPATKGLDAQKLHNDIMNIQAVKHIGLSYREGHRDARHAAAELVLAAKAKQGEQAND